MKPKLKISVLITGLALASWVSTSMADTVNADCDVRESGERKKGQSGPCQFSQRQGYIDIRLNNGKEYSLSPQGGANQYKDQKGRDVKRIASTGDMQQFKWAHRNITVNFDRNSHGGGDYNHGNGYRSPSDLVGVRARDGEAELENMGYEFVKSSKGSDRIWSNWWNHSRRECITVVTMNGRYDSVTMDTSAFDCDRDGSHNNSSHHGGGGKESYSDLVGARASSADSALRDRGFSNVDSFKSGNAAYTIWYNRRSDQCLQMAVADGRADSIVDIQTHPQCR